MFQPHYLTTTSGITPHQNDTQKYYLLIIVTSSILGTAKGIAKYTATKQSRNGEIWCTFLTHTDIKNKLLDVIPQGYKTIMVSSFAALVQRNHFGETNNTKLFRGTVKSSVSDVYTSFWTHLWGDLNLYAPEKTPYPTATSTGHKIRGPPPQNTIRTYLPS